MPWAMGGLMHIAAQSALLVQQTYMQNCLAVAPLYTRGLFAALAGHSLHPDTWQTPAPLPAEAAEDMDWWAANLQRVNGSCWWRKPISLQIAGDASEVGYAAYTLAGIVAWRMLLSFTQQEQERMHRAVQGLDIFSSTHRELANVHWALQSLVERHPEATQHTGIQWFSDSQTAVALLKGMKGRADCLQEVRAVYAILLERDLEVDWQWLPRDHYIMQLADEYSKEVDAGDIILGRDTMAFICNSQVSTQVAAGRRWGWPSLDVFAGTASDARKAAVCYTKYACPGTQGINAFAHPWDVANAKGWQLAWVFPPSALVADALNHIISHPCHAILILPAVTRPWSALLRSLPIIDSITLRFSESLFRVGSRAPAEWLAAKPQWWFRAYLVDPSQLAATPQPALQQLRYLRILDICGGVGTVLLAALQAGFGIQQYCLVEICEATRHMAASLRAQVASMYAGAIAPDAFLYVEALPQDLTAIVQEAIQQLGPFDLVVAAWPCQGLSRANRSAQGLADHRSGLFLPALGVLRACQAEDPRVSYIFENVLFMDHSEESVRAAWGFVCSELGQPFIMDAALLGPAHRLRAYWHSGPQLQLPQPHLGRDLATVLAEGRQPMIARHSDMPPMACFNIRGQPMRKFPTVMALCLFGCGTSQQ